VAEAGEKEMEADKNLHMGDTVGKQGLEYMLEKQLRGQKGLYRLEVDVIGRSLGRELVEAPKSGEAARLSLDLELQKAAWDALEDQAGGIVVMDPDTGRLAALVTSPSYDNNAFASGLSHKEWATIRDNPRSPLQNRVIQSVYPPGSVWKLVIAKLLLKEGVRPGESVHCAGQVQLGNQIFRCWKKDGHGSMNMMSALVHSCDVYFYHWGERMGIDKIEAYAHAAGFGERTGIDLPHENRGLVPSKAWKKRRFKQPWVRGETLNVSIGQGSTLITPMQMAAFVSSLMNGGKLLKPLLLTDAPVQLRREVPGSPEARKIIIESMRRTVESGTARVLQRPDALMGAKTGTAQVVKLKFASGDRRLKTHEMAYEQRDHAWIACYGEKAGKRYVVVAMVEHGGGGASVAGPVAKKIYEHLFGPLPTAVAEKQ
jgi:penicillin-binding protein 2